MGVFPAAHVEAPPLELHLRSLPDASAAGAARTVPTAAEAKEWSVVPLALGRVLLMAVVLTVVAGEADVVVAPPAATVVGRR